jgi:hypothetical protein
MNDEDEYVPEFTLQVTYANNGSWEYLHEKHKVVAKTEIEAYQKVLGMITRSDVRAITVVDIY